MKILLELDGEISGYVDFVKVDQNYGFVYDEYEILNRELLPYFEVTYRISHTYEIEVYTVRNEEEYFFTAKDCVWQDGNGERTLVCNGVGNIQMNYVDQSII